MDQFTSIIQQLETLNSFAETMDASLAKISNWMKHLSRHTTMTAWMRGAVAAESNIAAALTID
jgi:hypothetical protein